MLNEIASAIAEIEYIDAIAKAQSDSKTAYECGRLSLFEHVCHSGDITELSRFFHFGEMSFANESHVRFIQSAINRLYANIYYNEQNGIRYDSSNDTRILSEEESAAAAAQAAAAAEARRAMPVEDSGSDDEDEIRVICYTDKKTKTPNNSIHYPRPSQFTLKYDVSHSTDVHKDIFFHNMNMALQTFSANYGCIFDGNTVKCAYYTVSLSSSVKEVGSKKLKHRAQAGVLTVEYSYTSTDVNKAKCANYDVEVILGELYKRVHLYAKCDYICDY